MAACLACGLRDDSRVKMTISGMRVPIEQILFATISDGVRNIAWMLSEDGREGVNRPVSLTGLLTENNLRTNSEVILFDSGEEFDTAWKKLNGGM